MKLALIGFGSVGQGFARLLQDQAARLALNYGFNPSITAVATLHRGGLYRPDGLDPVLLLQAIETGSLDAYPDQPGLVRNMNSEAIIQQSNADVVIEASYTNLQTGQPAIDYCRMAFESGKHVVTANKGPVVLAFKELRALARMNTVHFQYEATVMSGTPVIQTGVKALAGSTITQVRGIFNGTTNYILSQMEAGQPYEQALADAQAAGYAEADPTADVDGWDSLSKVVILANTIMGGELSMDAMPLTGIRQITPDDIAAARQANERYKLIGQVWFDGDELRAQVAPERLPLSDPLAHVAGVMNAITYTTDMIGDVTMIGAGAGSLPTGFGILSDLLEIFRTMRAIE